MAKEVYGYTFRGNGTYDVLLDHLEKVRPNGLEVTRDDEDGYFTGDRDVAKFRGSVQRAAEKHRGYKVSSQILSRDSVVFAIGRDID